MSAWLRQVAETPCDSPAEWAVLIAIAIHCGEADGLAWPAVSTIAGMTGLSERWVTRCLGALVDRGVLIETAPPERLPHMRKIRTRAYYIGKSGCA